jgi:Rrf2 family transcriptional regulator, iron-sulfur cluster assembly transcription factor
MILSQTTVYAIRAVLYLADVGEKELVRVSDVASALEVPRNYLSKILHTLARAGLLASTRGPHGGFRLAVDAADLTLVRVVELFEEVLLEPACLLGSGQCDAATPCSVHDQWQDASAAMRTFLQQTTVRDVATQVGSGP